VTKKVYQSEYPPFYVAVDIVVLTVRDEQLHVMAIRRGGGPGTGQLALPGGFVQIDEDLEAAARRELVEETNLEVDFLEQVKTFGAPDRDPRGRIVSVLYLAVVPDLPEGEAGTDAAEAMWVPVNKLMAADLPFDHHQMLVDALERARAKLEYSPLAASFCGDTFTIGQLRRVYEIVWGKEKNSIDPSNFQRKVLSAEDFIVATGEVVSDGPGRPARVFRLGEAAVLNPPVTR
jgi:8-oxo-dGTP diphosphatase